MTTNSISSNLHLHPVEVQVLENVHGLFCSLWIMSVGAFAPNAHILLQAAVVGLTLVMLFACWEHPVQRWLRSRKLAKP